MTGHRTVVIAAVVGTLACSGAAVHAQERLTLSRALDAALDANPEVAAARAAAQEAEHQILQARAGFLPRLDFTQSWQRGNQPVFVFGSLLAQRQFAEADFASRALNHPDALANWRTALSFEQVLFDGGRTRAGVRAASFAAAAAVAAGRQVRNDLALVATRAYGQALRAAAERRAAESAVTSAVESLRTAEAQRDAGTGTEADALSMRVHLAQMRARAIDAGGAERIARADLNRLMSTRLDRDWTLEAPEPVGADVHIRADQAVLQRPEIEQAAMRRDAGRAAWQSARGALLPEVVVQGGYEWNDGNRGNAAGSWIAGATLRINLFSGVANIARMREASSAIARSEAELARADAAVRLELLAAAEQLAAARARQEIGRVAVLQARESQRMIRDRYEAGIAPAADVIRAATAVLDAEALRIGALVDLIVGAAALRRAAGQEAQP